MRLNSRVDGLVAEVRPADVANGHGDGACTEGLALLSDAFSAGAIQIGEDEGGALCGEFARRRCTHPRSSSSDEDRAGCNIASAS